MAVVLISRGTMSGGRALATCLSERMNLRSVSREDLVAVADTHGEVAKKVVEGLHRATRSYEQFSRLRRSYVILMRSALLKFAIQGNVVYHGRAGHLLLPNLACCLRVRITTTKSRRIENAIARLSLSQEAAREAVLQEDEEEVRWARFLYGCDIRDPHLYDAWFSLDRLTIQAICGMIVGALQEKEFQPTAETMERMANLHLATCVEAALVSDPRTSALEFGARAQGGLVVLEGPYLEDAQQATVLEIAGMVPGVTSLDYQPGYPSGMEFSS
jgi:cytidylate kinase